MEKVKAKDYSALKNATDGLSKLQLDEHFKLYEGYVDKLNEIQHGLEKINEPDGNYSYARHSELKRRLPVALNGVQLHELYFENLATDDSTQPSEHLKERIETDFNDWERWKADFSATGEAGPGWVILAYQSRLDRFQNLLIDEHHIGHVALQIPILVMDVWEHAYFVDYRGDRVSYMEFFLENVDWSVVNERFNQAQEGKTLFRQAS